MANDIPGSLLVLLRHGDAGDSLPTPELDAVRRLTGRGRKQASRAGKALRRMGLAPCDVWTSRLRRASETVAMALDACGAAPRVLRSAAVAPDADPLRVAKALARTPPTQDGRAGPELPPSAGALASDDPCGMPAAVPALAVPVRWIVGHDPHLTRLLSHLLGTAPEALRLSKGAFAVVSLDARGPGAGAGTLVCLLQADALKAITRKKRGKRGTGQKGKPEPKKRKGAG